MGRTPGEYSSPVGWFTLFSGRRTSYANIFPRSRWSNEERSTWNDTPDGPTIFFESPRGGWFINNNPGASLTGAIPLLILRPLLTRVDDWNQRQRHAASAIPDDDLFWRARAENRGYYFLLAGFITVALVMAPIMAGLMAYLAAKLSKAGIGGGAASCIAILCGLATPILYRMAYLNHNLLVAAAALAAFLLLWEHEDKPPAAGRAALSGLLAGYALLCDYSGVVVILGIGFYAWLLTPAKARIRVLAGFLAGVLPGAIALLVYQFWAFGAIFLPAQHYMKPTAPTSSGYRGFAGPSPSLLWANFFDPRFGIFAYCPALLLAFAAPWLARRVPRREMASLIVFSLLFIVFCAANQYSWLQPLTGFRYLVPIVAPLALLSIGVAERFARPWRYLLAGVSLVQTVILSAAHENSLRTSLDTLWHRHFELAWMIRLREAGLPFPRSAAVASFAILGTALACIWWGVLRPAEDPK